MSFSDPVPRALGYDPVLGVVVGRCGVPRLRGQAALLLRILLRDPGKVVAGPELRGAIGGARPISVSHLRVLVHRLRGVLDRAGAPGSVVPVQRVGYALLLSPLDAHASASPKPAEAGISSRNFPGA